MEVPFYTPVREYIQNKEKFDHVISRVLKRGDYILGEDVFLFEEDIKRYTNAKYAIACASGTDALVICSDILGFKNGKYVITTPFTFFASVSCVVRHGAKPIFVDINENTCQIDVDSIENTIEESLKKGINKEDIVGILPVHLFNQTCDMNKLMKIAKKYNLKVLEDGAESFGIKTKYNGELVHSATIGDFGIFSFFPTKTLGCYGDGGMIVTNGEKYYNLAKAYRVHGSAKKYYHDYIGYNSRLDTIQAAILRVKLEYIEESIKKRENIAKIYEERLSKIDRIKLFEVDKKNSRNVFYVFNIRTKERDKLKDFLNSNKIGTSIYYPLPLHLQKCFEFLGYKKGAFPISEKISEEILALPIFPELTIDEVNYVCDKIEEFFKKN